MNYSLTDFTAKELHTIIKSNADAVRDRSKDIDSIEELFEAGEIKTTLLKKRADEMSALTQLQVMLLTALQEVKQRETMQSN